MAISQLRYDLLAHHIQKTRSKYELPDDSKAFSYTFLESYFTGTDVKIDEIFTDGSHDQGVDALEFQVLENTIEIKLFNFKHRSSIERCRDRNFEANEIPKIKSFISNLYEKKHEQFKNANARLFSIVQDIWSSLSEGHSISIEIIFVSNGLPLASEERTRFEHFCNSEPNLSFSEYSFSDVSNLIGSRFSGSKEVNATLQVTEKQIFERTDGEVRGLIATVPAQSLYEAIYDKSLNGIKRHIFDQNIRVYLGSNGGYNKEIRETASNNNSFLFWYLNNGVTIVCDDYSYPKNLNSPIIKIKNFQIVNGAQTCNALCDVFNSALGDNYQEQLSNVMILVKIFATKRPDIYGKVAISTNSQARILSRDLKSNDQSQIDIQSAFRSVGILYERKKNEYENDFLSDPTNMMPRIDALAFGQAVLSMDLGRPDKAKTNSDEIFGNYYNEIFRRNWATSELELRARLFIAIDKRRTVVLAEQRLSVGVNSGSDWLDYANWYIMWIIFETSRTKNVPLTKIIEEIDLYILHALDIIDSNVNTYARSYYELFRSSKLKDRIMLREFSGQAELPWD